MPLELLKVKGKSVGLYLALLAPGSSQPPAAIDVSLTADAAAGDNQLTVAALAAALPVNTVLVFSRAALATPTPCRSSSGRTRPAGATTILVEAFEGEEGEGVPADPSHRRRRLVGPALHRGGH